MFENFRTHTNGISYTISKDFIDRILAGRKTPHEADFTPTDQNVIRGYLSNAQFLDYCYTQGGEVTNYDLPPIAPSVAERLFTLRSFVTFSHIAPSYTAKAYDSGYTLIFVLEGEGYLKYRRRNFPLKAGEGFFIDKGIPHEYGCREKNWKYAIAEFDGPQLKEMYDNYSSDGDPVFTEPVSTHCLELIERLLRLYQGTAPIYRDWQAHALITDFFVSLISAPHKGQMQETDATARYKNIQYLIIYMESNFTRNLTLDNLCRFSGYSRSALETEFKKYTGTSPNNYLIMLRLRKARELLTSTEETCSNIAYTCGFRDINNFNNLFRKYMGMTPNAYRKQHTMILPVIPN